MAEQDFDRNEPASDYKLEQAKKRGTVAKSQDVVYIAVLAVVVVFIYSMGWSTVRRELLATQAALLQIGSLDWTVQGVVSWLGALLGSALMPLAPLLLAMVIAAILGCLAQTGPVFSFQPLSPDFSRLNPATGFKRLFSLRMVYEGGKSTFKLAVVLTVLGLSIWHLTSFLLALQQVDARLHARLVLDEVGSLTFKLLLAMLVLAIIDYAYIKWEFARQMRMSRREVRDEHKQREGDPRIRSRLRELRQEVLQRSRSMQKLPEADVLLTNPTHYAVAVKYKHGEMPAPQVIAKGAGEFAAKMREAARRHQVMVVQNPPLARELYRRVDFDAYVPEELYPQVAKILVWVYAMRDGARRLARGQR
ncbi:flagellar biosynthesis protein FlhB [Chitinimonas lacunae]|uniref:Flagellar biosynthetic protein FlhB n=1 Tax=Chitinimonas lacunae TaxID=1963018 RepID=A0ABV8MXW1_9NEIS